MKQFYTKRNLVNRITLILAMFVLSVSAAVAQQSLTVPANTTITYNSNLNGNVTIHVYGTFNYNGGNVNGNGNNVIVYSGGTMNIGSNLNQLGSLPIDVRQGGVLNILTSNNFQFVNNGGVKNAGTINATNPSLVKFNGNTGFENSGTANFTQFEIGDNAPSGNGVILRENTGNINITKYFFIRGYFNNQANGLINVTGPCTSGNCGFRNGDGGSNQLINNGRLTVSTGTTVIEGPMTNNGTMHITGDLTISKPVTGTNGKLGVANGVSRINNGGGYSGTNMLFCDQNTTGSNFDFGANSNYTVNCPLVYGAAAPLPLRILSFDANEIGKTDVRFSWKTTEEVNVDRMQLQGSNDGVEYISIENHFARNTSGVNNYQSALLNKSNFLYYRLATIDKDGSIAYSKVIYINGQQLNNIKIYPNPVVNKTFQIEVPNTSAAIIKIFSIDGRMIQQQTISGAFRHQISLPQSGVSGGAITVQVLQGGLINSFKVMVAQ